MRHLPLAAIMLLLAGPAGTAEATAVADRAAPPSAEKAAPTPQSMENAIYRAFDNGDHARAAGLIETYLEHWPNSAGMLYNLACARSLLDERDAACSALRRAVQAGFLDFEHLRSDPDLDAIRGEVMYQAIIEAASRAEKTRAQDALELWKRTYGESDYRYEIDTEHKLTFATALDDVAHKEMREMLSREADHLIAELFEAPPSYFVLIAVPTPGHAHGLFGGDDAIGGKYEHEQRRLVARDIGGSLRHEFVHALHYGHMERLGIRTAHPIWIQEGLAALYEDYEWRGSQIVFLANERHNIVRRNAQSGRLTKWRTLFEMSPDQFMRHAGWAYPQSRSIFEFLADRGRHAEWYRTYVEHFDEDPTGAKAFEIVFDKPLDEIEQDWRSWVRRRPMVDAHIGDGDASLGIQGVVNGNNDGVLIRAFEPGSAARRALLVEGDVIVSVDGRSTRSMRELQAVIGAMHVGDRVEVRIRRKDEYRTMQVVLRPYRERRAR